MLGLSHREVDERFDQIAAFADIGDFIEQPVKTYSSGMFVRLAFAVQTAVEPQVLIVDEALSVGDVFFQQRCYERMRQLLDTGVCIVLASHDLGSVQQFCRHTPRRLAPWRGRLRGPLPPRPPRSTFRSSSRKSGRRLPRVVPRHRSATPAVHRPGPRCELPRHSGLARPPRRMLTAPRQAPASSATLAGARCTALAVCNACTAGEARLQFRQGETMAVFYEFEVLQDMEFCVGCLTICDKTNQPVHAKITLQDGLRGPARVVRGTRLRFRQDTVLNIRCADYTLEVALEEMISASLLDQPGITYDDYLAAQLRICEVHAAANFTVRLREETAPFQLLHFGLAGLPGHSMSEVILPDA